MTRPLVVVVAKRSMYERYIKEQRDAKALALLHRQDVTVKRWKEAHAQHHQTLKRVQQVLRSLGARLTVIRSPATIFDAEDASLVVSVGGDGTLLAASHHVGKTPIVGVNSSPGSSVGFFCAGHSDNLDEVLGSALTKSLTSVVLSRMEVSVNNRVCSRRVLNEALFCHAIPAATSRYLIEFGGQCEEHRSSGVWVGTAAGSTAATKSAGGKVLPFESQRLQLIAREPYRSPGSDIQLTRLVFSPPNVLTIRSKMEDARLYLDGPFRQIPVGLGEKVVFRVSDEPLVVLGLTRRRTTSSSQPPPPPPSGNNPSD